jgi:3-deoxy-D-manno-octulosonate 8-phosphate phosphatase KdsC-like HAD superfamily phosphatase
LKAFYFYGYIICKTPVREVCDFILKAQGKFDDAMKLYLD